GQATMVSLVPTMLERVLEVRDAKPFPASLRVALIGGAKTPSDLLARCRSLEVPVALTWGMSEAASQVATRAVGDTSEDGGAGAPLAFARVRTNDGLLEIAGPTVGGVLITRDRGHVDEQGRVQIEGRDDGVIVSGGEKLDPLEIERVLADHPQVRDACVVGVPSPRWGERPVALLVARGTPRPADADLDAWCGKALSRFKTPDRYVWVESLTTSVMDKRSRAALCDLLRVRAPDLFVAVDAGAPQGVRESGREHHRAKGPEVDERMHGAGRGAQHFVLSKQSVGDGDGLSARRLDSDLDAHALAQAHGLHEVGVGMNQRRAPIFGLEESLDAARRHGKKLFESLVAILEYPRKEDDARAVDVAKADGENMLESQGKNPRNEEDV
ncbi:MAG TPA: AMP-binding protein, partial [Myxococcota bacterium]|nr:AMP-binding protein [Myxococcota bacterium]